MSGETAKPIKTEANTPLSVDGPGGICCTSGWSDNIFRTMVIDNGLVPELAVTTVLPSGLRVNPYGCGAVTMLFPRGLISLPLGIMVVPFLSILANSEPEGAEAIHSVFSVLQPINVSTNKIDRIVFMNIDFCALDAENIF